MVDGSGGWLWWMALVDGSGGWLWWMVLVDGSGGWLWWMALVDGSGECGGVVDAMVVIRWPLTVVVAVDVVVDKPAGMGQAVGGDELVVWEPHRKGGAGEDHGEYAGIYGGGGVLDERRAVGVRGDGQVHRGMSGGGSERDCRVPPGGCGRVSSGGGRNVMEAIRYIVSM